MKYNVIAISGSIEEVSLATNILKKAKELNLDTLDIEVCTVENIPLLNVDLFQDKFPIQI